MTGDALGIDIFDKKWEDDEVWNHSMSYGKGKHTGQKRYDGSEPLPILVQKSKNSTIISKYYNISMENSIKFHNKYLCIQNLNQE